MLFPEHFIFILSWKTSRMHMRFCQQSIFPHYITDSLIWQLFHLLNWWCKTLIILHFIFILEKPPPAWRLSTKNFFPYYITGSLIFPLLKNWWSKKLIIACFFYHCAQHVSSQEQPEKIVFPVDLSTCDWMTIFFFIIEVQSCHGVEKRGSRLNAGTR